MRYSTTVDLGHKVLWAIVRRTKRENFLTVYQSIRALETDCLIFLIFVINLLGCYEWAEVTLLWSLSPSFTNLLFIRTSEKKKILKLTKLFDYRPRMAPAVGLTLLQQHFFFFHRIRSMIFHMNKIIYKKYFLLLFISLIPKKNIRKLKSVKIFSLCFQNTRLTARITAWLAAWRWSATFTWQRFNWRHCTCQ